MKFVGFGLMLTILSFALLFFIVNPGLVEHGVVEMGHQEWIAICSLAIAQPIASRFGRTVASQAGRGLPGLAIPAASWCLWLLPSGLAVPIDLRPSFDLSTALRC